MTRGKVRPSSQSDVSQARLEAAPAEPAGQETRRPALPAWCPAILPASLVVLAAAAAYCNSFGGPFVYDDLGAVVGNRSIRQLWPIWQPLSPPPNGETVSGRPLLNLSFAINYALGGQDVWGYHAANLAIHVAAALLLFGILRRTFLLPTLPQRFGRAATVLALAGALLWMLHPLQTESVTYVAQRAESLGGLCYLLTLYCVIRGAGRRAGTISVSPAITRSAGLWPAEGNAGETPALHCQGEKGDCPLRPHWYAAAVSACLLGMASKETMVTAPLVVLLYDRTFLAGSFREAWRRRWGLYVGLAATWALLGYLLYSTRLIVRQAELGSPDPWSYARSQPGVILHYLRLAVWPSPLCIDYAWPVASRLGEILPGATAIGLLAAATLWGVVRGTAWGFLGAWFFLVLAPTSSLLPLRQLAFEHRMYLPLAALAVLAAAGGYALWQRLLLNDRARFWSAAVSAARSGQDARAPGCPTITHGHLAVAGEGGQSPARGTVPLLFLTAVLIALGCVTFARNFDYASALVFWEDAVNKRPANPVAHYNLGTELDRFRRFDESIPHYQEALRLKPRYPEAHNNLGIALAALGRTHEAIEHYRQALRLGPDHFEAHNNLGNALAVLGKTEEAIEHCRAALRIKPDYAEAHNNLGISLVAAGNPSEAIEHYHQALRLKPNDAGTHNNLAAALAAAGKTDEAIEACRQALRINPDYAEAQSNLGVYLAGAGRITEAIECYQHALRLKPDHVDAHCNLASALAMIGRSREAVEHCRAALRIQPDYAEAHMNLANALIAEDKPDEAIAHYEQVLRLRPDYVDAHNNLGLTLATRGRTDEAIAHYQQALRLRPEYAAAHNNLGNTLIDTGKTGEAIAHYRQALRLQADYPEAHYNLGNALVLTDKPSEAIEHYRAALRLRPAYADACYSLAMAHYRLAHALAGAGEINEAVKHYDQTLQLLPDSLEALNDLAWLLATREPAAGGNPARSVRLAQRVRELGGAESPHCLDTLAAAYAAAGRFEDAATTAAEAVRLAEAAGQMPLASLIRERLELYRAGQPFRAAPPSSGQTAP